MVTLATWARTLPWQQVARLFRCSWGTVAAAVEEAVAYGLAHRDLDGLTHIGIDEISRKRGHSRQALRLFVHRQKSFPSRLDKIFKFWRGTSRWGPMASRGERRLFCRMQGRTGAPGRYRFHLPVGQPLASVSRSVADWDPYLGLMLFGPLGARAGWPQVSLGQGTRPACT